MGNTHWSTEDLEKLKVIYPTSPLTSLSEAFPDRSLSSMYHKAEDLGIERVPSARWLTGKNLNLTPAQAGYIAGIVDGEGSINTYKHRGVLTPQLNISNTDRNMLETVQIMIKGKGSIRVSSHTGQVSKTGPKSSKPCYRLWITNYDDIRQVLESIEPYLIIKKFKAQSVLQLLRERNFKELEGE
jgi:hypothetical protein